MKVRTGLVGAAPAVTALAQSPDRDLYLRAADLIYAYKAQLGLLDWHVEVMLEPELDVAGRTLYSYDKREAIISFRTELVRNDAPLLAYIAAHEVAHLSLAPLQVIRDRLLMGAPNRLIAVITEDWRFVEEAVVHKIAMALGTAAPHASFWWDPFNDGHPE